MGKRHGTVVFLAALLGATMVVPAAAAPPPVDQIWIVTLDDSHPSGQHARSLAQRHGGSLHQIYEHALNGFSFRGAELAARALERSPGVVRVEADRPVQAADHAAPDGVTRIGAPIAHADGYDGAGVQIAILDTGIDSSHPALDVDGAGGINCVDDHTSSTEDVNGHGTHVAGTASASVAGSTFVGAALRAQVVPVKVLADGGSGSWTSIICGVDHVTANGIGVANLSLTGTGTAGDRCSDSSLREAICNSVAAGTVYTVAAGNGAADVANSVPAAYPEVITVSALDEDRCARITGGGPPRTVCDEGLASFSNHGAGIDVIAPGVAIYSTVPGGYATKNGTSMATPHAAGVAALVRATNPALDPDEVRDLLQLTGECPDGSSNTATGACADQGQWFADPDGIAEPLINAPGATSAASDVPPPSDEDPVYDLPVADFEVSCTELHCSFTNLSTHDDELVPSYAWTFGDGSGSTDVHPTHTYADAGTYTVILTVTDTEGASDSTDGSITVSAVVEEPVEGVSLEVTGYKLRGLQKADLSWTSTGAASFEVQRDGATIATVGDATYTDHIDLRGSGTYRYRVCETDTEVCSEWVAVTF